MEEAQRAIQALNPIDRAVFAMTRAVIGNKRARSVFVMYAAGLVSYLYRCHSCTRHRERGARISADKTACSGALCAMGKHVRIGFDRSRGGADQAYQLSEMYLYILSSRACSGAADLGETWPG